MGNEVSTVEGRLRNDDPSLTSLELLESPEAFTDDFEDFLNAMKGNKTVKSVVILDFFTSEVIGPRWRRFMESLHALEALEQVELLDTNIPCDSLTQLLQKVPNLKAVAVQDGLNGVCAADICDLAEALQGRPRLEEFVLVQNLNGLSHGNQSSALDQLITSLATVPSLSILTVANSALDPAILLSDRVLECFDTATNLHTLDLSSLGLIDFHFQALAKAITHHASLKTLILRKNQAGPIGFGALTEMLERNYVLGNLSCDAHGSDKDKIDILILLNRHGRGRLLNRAASTQRDWLYVLDRLNDNPGALFYLLRESPEIWKRRDESRESSE